MAGEPDGKEDAIGIEPDAPPRVRSLPTRTETRDVPGAIAVLSALIAYVVLAYGVYEGSRIVFADDSSLQAVEAQAWSAMLFFGGILGLPGAVIAAGLLAPRQWGVAPFAGAVVGLAHYLIGYGVLVVCHRWAEALALPAGLAFSGLGWAWALPVRRWTSR